MLKLESISKTFAPGTPRQLKVLDKLSLDIDPGEFVVLLGNNGSGKSTLLKIIAGDLEADTGKVVLEGIELTGLPAHQRSKYLYRINQSREDNLASILTVAETFMLAMSDTSFFRILRRRKWESQVRELLGSLKQGLEDRIDDQIWSLSGGEHQIITVLIAAEMIRAHHHSGSLLLLDEHVAHLDPRSSTTVMRLTADLVQKYGLTTLMVTHNIQIASQYGNRVLVLKDGAIAFDTRYEQDVPRNPQEFLELIT